MKIYDFANRKRETGRVVFALSLDRERLAERIVIGREKAVRLALDGGGGEVYHDGVRPFGSLLFDFESDTNGEWESHIMTLCESYELKYFFGEARWNKVAPVSEFLAAKYAIVLAKLYRCRLSAAYVVDTATIKQLTLSKIFIQEESQEYERSLQTNGERYLAFVEELARAKGVKIERELRRGAVYTEILAVAEEKKADLIILGGWEKNRSVRSFY